jgi:hypothetical protein
VEHEVHVTKLRARSRGLIEVDKESNSNSKTRRGHKDVRRIFNHLTPNFSGRTAPLTYRCCIFYLFNRYTY